MNGNIQTAVNNQTNEKIIEQIIASLMSSQRNALSSANINMSDGILDQKPNCDNQFIDSQLTCLKTSDQTVMNAKDNLDDKSSCHVDFSSSVNRQSNDDFPSLLMNEYQNINSSNKNYIIDAKEDMVDNFFNSPFDNSPQCVNNNNYIGSAFPAFPGVEYTPLNLNTLVPSDVNSVFHLRENYSFNDFLNAHKF